MTQAEFTGRVVAMQDRLYRVSTTILPQLCDREDAVQGAIERALRKRERLRDERALEGWLVRILINEWAFVNQTGIVSFQLCDTFALGDVAFVPEKLLSEAELKAAFEKDNPRRIKDGFLDPAFISAELVYIPMRAANASDGMVIAPAWHVSYTFMDGVLRDGWAYYSALDGTLVQDCYS